MYLVCLGCFLNSKKTPTKSNQPKHSAQSNWHWKGCSGPKKQELLVNIIHFVCTQQSWNIWSQGSCQQLRIMLSVFQDRDVLAKYLIRAVFDPLIKKLMTTSLFSHPIITDVIQKHGKISNAAAIARNLGFSLKNRNSRSTIFNRHGLSITKAYRLKLNL